MVIILFIFFNIFFFSSQGIPTGFFCDDYLTGVYLIERGIPRMREKGWNGSWVVPYPYQNLDVVPGDLIRITCYTRVGGAFGSGCFFIYDECLCYDFNIDKPRGNTPISRTVILNNNECKMNVYILKEMDVEANNVFQQYVPLNASELTCINNNINNTIIALNGEDINLSLSNYISSNYSIKNVESSITQYYNYFKLNNKVLILNQKFNVSNTLIFNSKIPQKYYIIFRNYGKVINDIKECGLDFILEFVMNVVQNV